MGHPGAEIEANVEEYRQLRKEGAPYGALIRLAYAAHFLPRARSPAKRQFFQTMEAATFPKAFIQQAVDEATSERNRLDRILMAVENDDLLVEEVFLVVSMRIS